MDVLKRSLVLYFNSLKMCFNRKSSKKQKAPFSEELFYNLSIYNFFISKATHGP